VDKGKFALVHTVKSYGRVEVEFHPFLYSALNVNGRIPYHGAHYERQRNPCPPGTKILFHLTFHSKELVDKMREKS